MSVDVAEVLKGATLRSCPPSPDVPTPTTPQSAPLPHTTRLDSTPIQDLPNTEGVEGAKAGPQQAVQARKVTGTGGSGGLDFRRSWFRFSASLGFGSSSPAAPSAEELKGKLPSLSFVCRTACVGFRSSWIWLSASFSILGCSPSALLHNRQRQCANKVVSQRAQTLLMHTLSTHLDSYANTAYNTRHTNRPARKHRYCTHNTHPTESGTPLLPQASGADQAEPTKRKGLQALPTWR